MTMLDRWASKEPATQRGGSGPTATGDLCEQQGPLTSGAASSAAIQILHVPAIGEVFVTFMISGNAVRMNFGPAGVAAADTNSPIYPVGEHRFRITADRMFFRHLQVTGAGEISFWVSSRGGG